jgi:hypothetical protein
MSAAAVSPGATWLLIALNAALFAWQVAQARRVARARRAAEHQVRELAAAIADVRRAAAGLRAEALGQLEPADAARLRPPPPTTVH